jgi:hypothetical protein
MNAAIDTTTATSATITATFATSVLLLPFLLPILFLLLTTAIFYRSCVLLTATLLSPSFAVGSNCARA